MLVSTTNDIPGHRIVRHLGLVRGVTVRDANEIMEGITEVLTRGAAVVVELQ